MRGTTLAARGWTREGGDLWETLARLDAEGCARYVVTDVNKDGMLQGPNVELLRDVCARTDRPVVACGGVSTLEDIAAIRGLVGDGVEGAIVGSALYRGAFTLPEALDVAGPPGRMTATDAGTRATTTSRAVPPTPPVRRGQGKSIPSHGFSGDTGAADAALARRPRRRRTTRRATTRRSPLMEHAAQARWLVPVVAVAAEVDESGPHAVDTRSDMAAVTLTSPDGSRALPMFTSLESLAAWDPDARPVPVRAAAAAQAAISEECHVLVVDVASRHATVLRPSMLWALAQERAWEPSHRDAHVAAAVRAAVEAEPAGRRRHRVEAGEPAGAGVLRVVLALRARPRRRPGRGHRHPDRGADRDRRRDPCEDRCSDLRARSGALSTPPAEVPDVDTTPQATREHDPEAPRCDRRRRRPTPDRTRAGGPVRRGAPERPPRLHRRPGPRRAAPPRPAADAARGDRAARVRRRSSTS